MPVDESRVGGLGGGRTFEVMLPAGPHAVYFKPDWWKSDVVELELRDRERVELVCSIRPLLQGRFPRFVELRILIFAFPLAIVYYFCSRVMELLDQHLVYELLAIVFLFCVGGPLAFPRLFSRKPGAMLALVRTAAESSSASDLRAAPGELMPGSRRAFREGHFQDGWVESWSAEAPSPPSPIVFLLTALNTLLAIFCLNPWLPPEPALRLITSSFAIGLLLAFQTTVWRAVRRRRRQIHSSHTADPWSHEDAYRDTFHS